MEPDCCDDVQEERGNFYILSSSEGDWVFPIIRLLSFSRSTIYIIKRIDFRHILAAGMAR